MNIEEVIERLSITIATSKFETKDYPNCIVMKQDLRTLLTAYEKEKGENVKLRLQDIPLIEGELKAHKDRVDELKAELEKEKEIIKNAICFLKYYNKDFNKMSDNEIKQILYSFGKCADIKKEE